MAAKSSEMLLNSGLNWNVVRLGLVLPLGAWAAADEPPSAVPAEMLDKVGGSVIHVALADDREVPTCFSAVAVDRMGWFVVPLAAVSFREAPRFHNEEGRDFPLRKVRAVSAELDLAVVELQGGGLPFLKLAEARTKQWEPVALVWGKELDDHVAHGPVLSHRIQYGFPSGAPTLDSLGVRVDLGKGCKVHRGSPVLNASGELAGIFVNTGVEMPGYPGLVLAAPSTEIRKLLAEAEAAPDGLAFPLNGGTPYDAAYWEYQEVKKAFASARKAAMTKERKRELKQAEFTATKALARKYPDSKWALTQSIFMRLEDVLREAAGGMRSDESDDGEALEPGRVKIVLADAVADFKRHGERFDVPMLRHRVRMVESMLDGDVDAEVEAIEEALREWGEDPPVEIVGALADAYAKQGKVDKAAAMYEQVVERWPDCLPRLTSYSRLLVAREDWEANRRITELIYRVEDVYRPK